jgi:ABC-type Zn uptake system ZnuABC Zn-binding protein ZnuA
MKKFALLFQTALWIMFAATAYSQSLADLANKEKERRQEVKDDKVITDEQAAKYRSEPVKTDTAELPLAKTDPGKKDSDNQALSKTDKPGPDEPVDFEGRPESYWRKTMAEARQKVKDLENEANVIILKISSLQTQFYSESDGFKREGIGREIQKCFYEQDRNKEELAKAKDILQDLEKEARKSGALPGWIQEK